MSSKLHFELLFLLLLFSSYFAFSQDNDPPNFMAELNAGYSIGINLDNAFNLDVRFYYPAIKRFGLVLEAGGLFSQDTKYFNLFIAPMFFVINTEKWRVPVAVGFDLFAGDTFFYGIGGLAAVHYSITRNFYVGFNFGVTYAFDNRYDELTGYRKENYFYTDPATGFVKEGSRDVPVYETKSHFGSYIYLKPSIVIGIQF